MLKTSGLKHGTKTTGINYGRSILMALYNLVILSTVSYLASIHYGNTLIIASKCLQKGQ